MSTSWQTGPGVAEVMTQAAPGGPIAKAARAYGDDYPTVTYDRTIRAAAVLLCLASVIYVPWVFVSLGPHWWISVPFAAVTLWSVGYAILTAVNLSTRKVPPHHVVATGAEPLVAVIVPTCGEPVPMILRSVLSILEQDWPTERLFVVVSDDGHDPALRRALEPLPVRYFDPPGRWAPGRDGAAKAGNLNAALDWVLEQHPDVAWIETRDADDEVGSSHFLREVVGQLLHDPKLAYVQTIKEAQVSAGDPFNNWEPVFYRGEMLARNAHNAAFPCGSGVVWRREALSDIGGFPTWNLVEDLQSGIEALRRGWRGLYLPIVGAVGQIAPEDLPNFVKQRGTWAIDTIRLMIWGDLRGLSWRQRGFFYGQAAFYLDAFAMAVYLPCVGLTLWGLPPLDSDLRGFLFCFAPMMVAMELWLLALNRPFFDRRIRQRNPYGALWRQRAMRAGMAPVFVKAAVQAIIGGRHRKPSYVVTRKAHDMRWHWRQTVPQSVGLAAVVVIAIVAVFQRRLPTLSQLVVGTYWGALNTMLLGTFITRGWHGLWRGGALARASARRLASRPGATTG
ncbi:MAG: glycosyltransferase [Acidimicrobiales bacterium]